MENVIDLRSDTVSKPTPQMREAMATARVGDDVYGEDPTVNALQEKAAELLGKEAGLFVPSGTMGNLASVLTHCGRGDEVILGTLSHIYLLEAGGISALGGVHPRPVPNLEDARIPLDEIEAAVRPDDAHFPKTGLIALESTHNRCRGEALSLDYCLEVKSLADARGISMHLDGARIFNAAAALGRPAAELAGPFDSVTFCLSKGLCAPVGSVIVGSEDFIRRAHRARKILGGGMRQAGIIAAAGLVALETMVDRIAEDHRRAQRLAGLLAGVPGLVVENPAPASNMVYLRLAEEVALGGRAYSARLEEKGLKVGAVGVRRFRMVTHFWIEDDHLTRAADILRESLP